MSVMILEQKNALSSGEEAMKTLTEKWYNGMVTGLNLSPRTFQIYQSNTLLGNLSSDLWAIYDSIPPFSIVQSESAQISRFSDNYSGVINTVLPSSSLEWKKTMGDSYPDWVAYLKEVKRQPLPPGGMLALFTSWAQLNLPDPGKAQKAITQYSQILNGVVPVAQGRFINAAGVYAYGKSIEDLRAAVKQAPSASYKFNSKTTSGDVSHVWAQGGSVIGIPGFVWKSESGSFDSVNQKFASSEVAVDVSFKHVLSFAAGPLQTATFVGDKQYPAWFSSAALSFAYQNKGNDVWPVDGSASWASTFGERGNLKRFATNLFVADEMSMTLSSSAVFSALERTEISKQASGGFWPFYRASGAGGASSTVTFDSLGKMVATATSPAGSPLILGVNVLPIDQIFG